MIHILPMILFLLLPLFLGGTVSRSACCAGLPRREAT